VLTVRENGREQLMRKIQLLCVAIAVIGFAGMASAATLVSNLSQPMSDGFECNYGNWFASPFVTDDQDWNLVSVTLRLTPLEMPSNQSVVWIFADNGSDHPGSSRIAALVNPALPIGIEGDYTFTASPPILLAPNTRYYVALGSEAIPSQNCYWYRTASTAYSGIGIKPFLAYIDTGHDFDWNYTRDYYTMMFEVEVEPATVATEQSSWGTIKSLYRE
jgi:hypothetical protein